MGERVDNQGKFNKIVLWKGGSSRYQGSGIRYQDDRWHKISYPRIFNSVSVSHPISNCSTGNQCSLISCLLYRAVLPVEIVAEKEAGPFFVNLHSDNFDHDQVDQDFLGFPAGDLQRTGIMRKRELLVMLQQFQ